MNRPVVLAILLCLSVLALPGISLAAGLGINLGDINIDNVSPGKTIAVSASSREKLKLSIQNKGISASTYEVNILPTAQTTAKLNAGYLDIPDTSWIYAETKELRIPGNSSQAVELYLKIPAKKEYFNKKYQAIIEVKSKKNRPDELFVLACQLKMLFSTSAGGKNENK